MSGQTVRPRCSKSSPVLTARVRSSAGNSAASPKASLAPPTPPQRARTWLIGPSSEQILLQRPKDLADPLVAGRFVDRATDDRDGRALGRLADDQGGGG